MDRADDPYDKEACTKLIQEFWGGMLLTDNHNMTFVPNKITALLVDSESKIVLAGKFGQLDTTTTEKGVHIDMNTGDLKEQLLKMAREEGREARLCSKDKSVNLVFKFLPSKFTNVQWRKTDTD
jgi:hypothetical protein